MLELTFIIGMHCKADLTFHTASLRELTVRLTGPQPTSMDFRNRAARGFV
jgi:hypothetical protein